MLEGIVRESTSKSAVKSLRRDGYLIANVYGKGVENISAAFPMSAFMRFVKNKETLPFDIKLGKNTYKVVIQEYQKHPVKSEFTHVDLLVAVPGYETYYQVPVFTEGEPKGLKNKGLLVFHRRRIKVKCSIENLPNKYVFDVKDLDVGDSILVRDIDFGEGVKTFLNPSVPIVGVIKAK